MKISSKDKHKLKGLAHSIKPSILIGKEGPSVLKNIEELHKLIGDFRAPNLMRFGICPLFIDEKDILQSVKIIKKVLDEKLWKSYQNISRAAVT